MDHMALLYLINKLQLSGKIVRWLLLFLEYNFTMVYKPRCSHIVANVISQLPEVTENLGNPNRTIDASLFILHRNGYKKDIPTSLLEIF
jgi:hypothetical protein